MCLTIDVDMYNFNDFKQFKSYNIIEMQLAHQEPVWYFIFGPKQKSSLASQYALEHHLHHLVNPTETTLHQHEKKGLIIEGSADLFRSVQKWKAQITAIFVHGQYSQGELKIKRDYEIIGRLKYIKDLNYNSFRKELYPQLIILYGPSKILIQALTKEYFSLIGYKIVEKAVTANELISKYQKSQNYLLVNYTPEISEINILETFFHIKIIHLKHQRTELAGHEAYFDQESALVPLLQKKNYFHSISTQQQLYSIIEQIGQKLVPQLIFVNVRQTEQRQIVHKYIDQTNGLLLNIFDILPVLKNKASKAKGEGEKLQILNNIVFKNLNRSEILFTDYPEKPEEFHIFETHTRNFKLFADCSKPDHYQFSKNLNSSIYFLETLRRRQVELDFPFQNQIKSFTKYLAITGAPCAGKTSAAKFIVNEFGYKHIEYDAYVATLKQKLIVPEDGEELPFRKVIAHFATLVAQSGNTPLLIDGLNIDAKQIENWVKAVGPPTILNLKVQEKELIRRNRKKNEADVNSEVTEEEAAKTKEAIAKNSDWAQQFTNKSPLSTIYQIQFSQQLILAEQLLKDILKPRVYLVQDNGTYLYQNLAIKHNFGYFNLLRYSLKDISDFVRKGSFRDVLLCNYHQHEEELISKDFYWIERNIGTVRYLSIWSGEKSQSHDEALHLQRPPQVEKPKPAEGEEGGEAPPPEEEGQAKKKVFNIYDHNWTKPGNQKNLSQWFYKQKRNPSAHEFTFNDLSSKGLTSAIEHLAANRENCVYHKISG